jgi:hypothetical protein
LAAGDIDAAHGPDLVIQSFDSCGPDCNFHSSARVYLNNGSGSLAFKSQIDMGNMAGGSNILADISGDNRLDLVNLAGTVEAGRLQYALYKGSGTFSPFTLVTHFEAPTSLVARDFNLDSRHDLAITENVGPATWTFLNTSAATICAPPSSANLAAKMCAPSSSPGTRTFIVRGSGNSPVGVRRVELWVDGKKIYDSPDDRLKRSVTLSAGTHRIVVRAVDQFGALAKVVKNVTVP